MLAEIRLPVGGLSLGPWYHVLRSHGVAIGLVARRSFTVLLGITLIAVIATIVGVGGWINAKWTALNTGINGQ
jgi:hypothetical protein